MIYEDGTAKCLLTEEGYVSLDDREYHYYLKDHQGSLLSEASKPRLLNGLVLRGTDAIARPIGEFFVWNGTGELGGLLIGKAIGLILGKVMTKVNPLLRPLGLGNTGRFISRNLTEKLAMQEILANPAAGEIIES